MIKKILFVCLGNICRSPAAEAVFLYQIKLKGIKDNYEVDSAGTGAWHAGNKADRRMRNAASKRGIDIKSIARQIQIKDFIEFDLIVTMDNSNFEHVKSLAIENDYLNEITIVPLLSFLRSSNLTEVPDPYYGGESGFEEVLDLLEDACEGLLNYLISQE